MADTPITVDCKSCSATWETTASYRSAVICPACGERRYIGRADRARPLPQWSDDGEPGPEPDADGQAGEPGYDCPECGAGMAWVGARTALECPECGHWQASPQSAERAGNRLAMQAKPAQDKPGGITTTQLAAHAQFLAQRQALIADLIRLAEIFNPDSLPEQYEAYASEKYGLCMSHAETARTKVTDNESLAAMTAVSQELRASLVNDIGTFTYMRRIAERDIVQGEIVQSEQRAITSGNAPDYDYGDDDTDDYDDTPRVEFAPSGAGLQVLGVIIIAGVIVYGIWRGWEAYLDSEVPIKCEGKHVISRPSATRIVQGANYGTIINDGNGYYCCPKHTDNGSQYLTDAFGYPGTVYIDSESGPYSETRRNKRNRKASNTNSAIPPSGIAN